MGNLETKEDVCKLHHQVCDRIREITSKNKLGKRSSPLTKIHKLIRVKHGFYIPIKYPHSSNKMPVFELINLVARRAFLEGRLLQMRKQEGKTR